MIRAYVRVSTDRQAESGLGLEAQKSAIIAWARAQQIPAHDVSWHIDAGRSGSSLDGRPEMVLLLANVRPGDRIVTAKLDRLSRSVLDFATLAQRSLREGWSIVCLDLGLDLSSPAGQMVANVLAAIGQWERQIIGEKTSAALAQAKARGRLPGKRSSLPRDVQDLLIRMDDEKALTLRERAQLLNERGIPTAMGGRWSTGTVDGSTRSARLEAAARLVQQEQAGAA
jgi:DNA invertase Pin-like site-specific DNA recombinase